MFIIQKMTFWVCEATPDYLPHIVIKFTSTEDKMSILVLNVRHGSQQSLYLEASS